MSQCNDILSINESFEDSELVLHPSFMPIATPAAINDSQKRKAKVTPGVVTGAGTPQRGRAWREKDSILLVKAFEWIEENRKGTVINYILMIDWESQPIQDDKMYKHWLFLGPDETGRTSTSVIARWKDMVSMFKYFFIMSSLLIVDSLLVSMITRLLAQPAVQSGFICLRLNNSIIFERETKATKRKLKR